MIITTTKYKLQEDPSVQDTYQNMRMFKVQTGNYVGVSVSKTGEAASQNNTLITLNFCTVYGAHKYMRTCVYQRADKLQDTMTLSQT